ncbi:MAG: hypothetical protein WC516_02610 [Patescibacteria group bacterium]
MENLKKIVNLLKKTGDKAIILDENGDPSYVIMTLGDYEGLILGKAEVKGLTEDELLDKINRDIAIWQDNQKQRELPIDQYDFSLNLEDYYRRETGAVSERIIANESDENEEDRYYFEPIEQ